jgi:hypothetical protein
MLTSTRRLSAAGLLVFLLHSQDATAQFLEITPEVFNKVQSFATSARAKDPASPKQAWYYFQKDFIEAFGEPHVPQADVVDSEELHIELITPLHYLYELFAGALLELEPIPKVRPLSVVRVRVSPRQTGAPNVRRVVLFLDNQQVAPTASTIKPTEFKNGLGASFTKGAGIATWSPTIFDGKGKVRLVVMTDGAPIEWPYFPGYYK